MITRNGLAPLAPVRAHITQLRAAGMGLDRIAALARIPVPVVETIAAGTPAAKPHIHAETAHRILGVHPRRFLAGDSRRVDATGARRRVQALVAIGWSRAALAARAPLHVATIDQLLTAPRCEASTAAHATALFEALWNQSPPASTPAERDDISAALSEARRERWAPPMSWDEEELDDPSARPRSVRRARVTAVDRLDEMVHLLDLGIGLDDACHRVGYARCDNARRSALRAGHDRALHALDREQERAA